MGTSQINQRTFKDYLIPYYSCTYKSKLSKEDILNKIRRRTEPEQFFRMSGWLSGNAKTKEFEGVVNQDDFKISKIRKNKKSNAPVMLGHLNTSNQYTRVKIRLRPRLMVIIFIPIYLIFMASIIFDGNFSEIFIGETSLNSFFPFFFLLLMYGILTGSFHMEVSKSLRFLDTVIEPVDDINSGASWITRN